MPDDQMEMISRALSEPRRMQMLRQIGELGGLMPCSVLVKLHDVGAATVSRHVRELQLAGLVEYARDGKSKDILLQRDVLHAYLERLAEI